MKWITEHPIIVALFIVGSVCSVVSVATSTAAVFGIAMLFFVAAVALYFLRRDQSTVEIRTEPVVESTPTPAPNTKQWLDCAYCDGTGKYVKFGNAFRTDYATCTVCSGHGQLNTNLWAQPDCRRCSGTGKLTSKDVNPIAVPGRRRVHVVPQVTTNIAICDVCDGIGKRPHLDQT